MRSVGKIVTFLLLLVYLATGGLVGHLRCHHHPATPVEAGVKVVENSGAPLPHPASGARVLRAQPGLCCGCLELPPTLASSSGDGLLDHFLRLPAAFSGPPSLRTAAVFADLAAGSPMRAALESPPSRQHLRCLHTVVLVI